MLTKLRFKNWRSLQDVTIDNLTPLTVFIGANSSGKTNIVDGLKFLREANEHGINQAVHNRRGMARIAASELSNNDTTELSFASVIDHEGMEYTYILGIRSRNDNQMVLSELMTDDQNILFQRNFESNRALFESHKVVNLLFHPPEVKHLDQTTLSFFRNLQISPFSELIDFLMERLQILDEGFKPALSVVAGNYGDITVIERDAGNLPIMLNFLQEAAPEKYAQLQDDLQLLMGHVGKLVTYRDDRETRFYIEEKAKPQREAPTISAGTARIVAMLTAYYALDIGPRASMPGLVVIEEPDTAINPGLLSRFVSLLRDYVEREHPRQFILTTHNPVLLNYFKPEEVRVVERDEAGMTTVHTIPEHVSDIWLDKYGLGEVWTTNSFGGLPV